MPKITFNSMGSILLILVSLCLASALACHGGGSYDNTNLPPPQANPAQLRVESVVITPGMVQPSATGASITVTIRNQGSTTAGAVSGTLTPKDAPTLAHVGNLLPAGPVAFTTVPLGTNATAQNALPFTFDVAAAHIDGTPLCFSLTLTDGTATWPVDVFVPVPWTSLSVVGWVLTATANGDHLPDPGETVGISIIIKNTGTGSTNGQVTGTLSVNPASTAPATIIAADSIDDFGAGPITEGATATGAVGMNFKVDAAAVRGTEIMLDLTLTDATSTWVRPVILPLN